MRRPDDDTSTRREAALAWACDHAGCTRAQAGALKLLLQGKRLAQIRRQMGLSWAEAKRAVQNGRERLEEAFEREIAIRVAEIRAVLHCHKNHQDCRPAPILTYARVPGGYDETPVTVRARPHGAVPEDLIEDPRDFLRVITDFCA